MVEDDHSHTMLHALFFRRKGKHRGAWASVWFPGRPRLSMVLGLASWSKDKPSARYQMPLQHSYEAKRANELVWNLCRNVRSYTHLSNTRWAYLRID